MSVGDDLLYHTRTMKRTKTTLKSYFETGDKPTQTQYEHLIDSLRHLDDKIPLADLEEGVAKKNEDNNFSTLQTFGNQITVNGTGDSTFNTPLVLNDALTTNAGIDAYGDSSFDSNLEVNGLLSSNTGLNIQPPLTSFDVANQPTGSITIANNAGGAEAPTIAGKTDSYSPGLQFIGSVRDTSGTFADMVFNVRENNNSDFNNELDTVSFQFSRFSTPLVNIYRNGRQENLFGLNVQSDSFDILNLERTGINNNVQIGFTHNGGTAYLGFGADENLRFGTSTDSALNGQVWTSDDAPTFDGLITANNGLKVLDDQNFLIGTNGLRLWHSTSGSSYIDKSSGDLYIRNESNDDDIHLQTLDANGNVNIGASFYGSTKNVKLRFDNSVKLETSNDGIIVDRLIRTPTDAHLSLMPNGTGNIYFGNSTNGNNIYHYSRYNDGKYTTFSHSPNQSKFSTTHTDGFLFEKKVEFNDEGIFGGLLYANAGIKVSTIIDTPANTDLNIRPHGTGNIHFGNSGNGNKLFHYSQLNDGKYTSFSHNSTQSVFDTTSTNGFLFEKEVEFNDKATFEGLLYTNSGIKIPNYQILYLGDSGDLRLWNSGTDSWIDNHSGNIYINNKDHGANIHMVTEDDAGFVNYGVSVYGTEKNVSLRYNNLTRLTTTIDGIDITGDIKPSGNYISSDGTPGYNGNFTIGTYDITVKDGLITNVTDVS